MNRRVTYLLVFCLMIPTLAIATKKREIKNDRQVWCEIMYRMAAPVLSHMSEGKLQENMELELSPTWDGRDKKVSYMECFGRLMAGLAPWISLPEDDTAEGRQRSQLREWALSSYKNAVDPESPDYLLWDENFQTLVDAAYVAESFLRGYESLWLPLDPVTKERYIKEFTGLHRIDPLYTNWLLFTATIETFLKKPMQIRIFTASTPLYVKLMSGMWEMAGIRMVRALLSTITIVLPSNRCILNVWKY